MSQFYLMNKDTRVASFICDSIGIKNISIIDIYREELLPIGIRNGLLFSDWLNNRLDLSHRKNTIIITKRHSKYQECLLLYSFVSEIVNLIVKERRKICA